MAALESRLKINKVFRACDRCKKQKLKCDVERPCTLCRRSGIACTNTGCPAGAPTSPLSAPTSGLRPVRKRQRRSSNTTTHREGLLRSITETLPGLGSNLTLATTSTSTSTSNLTLLSSEDSSETESPNVTRSSTLNPAMNTDHSYPANSQPHVAEDSSVSPVFGFNDSQHHSETSALPGGTEQQSPTHSEMLFSGPHLPPPEIVEALIDSYFETVHWFMFILHEGSFRQQAERVIALGPRLRTPSDADFAALLMMVIALGAQYAKGNPSWKYRDLMVQHAIDPNVLVPSLVRQVRMHLLDSVERCQLEAVQTCILLGTYYIYHGNPSLSWSILGLAVKTAYALGMHREVNWKGQNALLQARKRAWGHTYIADTFAAVIYGRPATVDRNYCNVSYPDECDDTSIPMPLRWYLRSINDGENLSKLSYHTQKYKLYEIKAQIISKIYNLRARASFQASGSGVPKLVKIVQGFDRKLKDWRGQLPLFFKESNWTSGQGDPADVFFDLSQDLSEAEEQIKNHLLMQKIALRLLYDYILILLHRPLLEYRMASGRQGQYPESSNRNPFPSSFDTCMDAAMRISFTPANIFEHNCPMALITMHMLTAGLVLCIPATMDPFSLFAHKAKGAVVRMIRNFKRLSAHTPVVAQSCTILEELMKVVLKRELELVLNPDLFTDQTAGTISSERDLTSSKRPPSSNPPATVAKQMQASSLNRSEATQLFAEVSGPSRTSVHHATANLAQPNSSFQQCAELNEVVPNSFGPNASTVSPEGIDPNQSYEFLNAEPDHDFNMAFGALERVICDVAPSEWINPAWMHSYEITEPYQIRDQGFGQQLTEISPGEVEVPFTFYDDGYSSLSQSSHQVNAQPEEPFRIFAGAAAGGNERPANQHATTNLRASWP